MMRSPNLSMKAALLAAVAGVLPAAAAPVVTRLTPPSMLFSFNDPGTPVTARFLPGQRFDLQATVAPDAGQSITAIEFRVDGGMVAGAVMLTAATVSGVAPNSTVGTRRAYSQFAPGVHVLEVRATQSDGTQVSAKGNFEVVRIDQQGRRAKNLIVCIGDGMGIAHRTAARLMKHGAQQGKANALLAMDQFPFTGLAITHSLNSIVTDSAPGAHCYSTGNKANNNQEGVFPDDTTDKFDNPRIEYVGEYLARTQGKSLGIVTTADVFDATPAAFAVHTQDRGAGTGICDQYLDEAARKADLRVLLGGGRKWFLPKTTPGSARSASSDYVLPAELATGWSVSPGVVDVNRNLIADFQAAGFTYVPDATSLNAVPASTKRLLGLFSFSNMNVAKDKIDKRRNPGVPGVVDDYGFPDQPMLDEMTDRALDVLRKNANGFVLMVEGASIDKQAHNMDTERWILDTIEFDNAVERCRQFALSNPDTLVIVTADHECAGVNIIGASTVTDASLASRATGNADQSAATRNLRDGVVGLYDAAGFPVYAPAADGFPQTTDIDRRMLIGYASSADRYETWRTKGRPIHDSQQPFDAAEPLAGYPRLNTSDSAGAVNPLRPIVNSEGNFWINGQVPGSSAAHTASDIPVSAFGRGASQFTGVMDNTDVFFKAMQALMGGVR